MPEGSNNIIENEEEVLDIRYLDSRISWVFNYVIIPFDLRELINSFSKQGYITPKREELPPLPYRGRLGGSGVIARKGEFDIYTDTDRQIISVRSGTSFDRLFSVYQDIKNIITEDFDVDFSQDLRYCELLSEVRVKSKKAIEKIRSIPFRQLPELEKIVGEYSLIGFRIRSKKPLLLKATGLI